jgi:hypothetical protein
VSVAVRTLPEVFALAVYVTVLDPVPDAPAVTVSQLAELVAVHGQSVKLVSATVALPLAATRVTVVGDTVYVQPLTKDTDAIPAWPVPPS